MQTDRKVKGTITMQLFDDGNMMFDSDADANDTASALCVALGQTIVDYVVRTPSAVNQTIDALYEEICDYVYDNIEIESLDKPNSSPRYIN